MLRHKRMLSPKEVKMTTNPGIFPSSSTRRKAAKFPLIRHY